MHVNPKLKLNKFSYTSIPSASALFALRGAKPSIDQGTANSEEFGVPINRLGNKLESLALGEQVALAAKRSANGDNPDHRQLDIDPTKL